MKLAVIAAIGAALAACGSPTEPSTPPAPAANPQAILDRFTRNIWPVVAAFNADPEPIHKPYEALRAIMADDSLDHSIPLYNAVGDLGYPPENDRAGAETMHGNDGLHLRAVDVLNVQRDNAILHICYTYTHYWSARHEGVLGDAQHAPGASEATFGLLNRAGTWMLNSVSDDHVIASCPSNRA